MKERLRQVLAQRQKWRIVDTSRVQSAVLIPIYCKENQYHILFTKRTEKVANHKGQISFPGGTCEEGESPLDTALREAAEEICLMPGDVEVLGELDDIRTSTTNYVISPFVVVIPWPYPCQVDGEEIERLIEVPISALLDTSFLRQEIEVVDGETVPSYFYHYRGEVIWGATARILTQLLDILRQAVKNTGLECDLA